MTRLRGPGVWAVVVGVAMASGMVLVAYSGYPATSASTRSQCSPGPVVARVSDAPIPQILVNSPFPSNPELGSEGISYGPGGSMGIYAGNGTIEGTFAFMNWTVRVGEGGSSSSTPCDQSFFLNSSSPRGGLTIQVGNGTYSNDSQEPNSTQGVGIPGEFGGPIYYWNGFYHETSRLSTCGTNRSFQFAASTHVVIGVSFTYLGVTHVTDTTIAENTNYQYVFPANAGTWAIDNLSMPGGPGGGWAFSFLGTC